MQDNNKNNYGFALLIIGVLFFIFGFITWANSQLIPYLKIACQLTTTQSYYVASAFFAAYFVMAIPSSYVLKATGFKKGMSLGLFVMALGAIIFIPAANARSFPVFLTGLFIIGTGLALLQTASNPYAAALGPKESAARRISIMGVCNKVAGILAVYALGSIILKDSDAFEASLKVMDAATKEQALNTLAHKVIMPYTWIAVAFATIGLLLFFVKLPEIADEETITDAKALADTPKTSVLQFPHLVIGVIALFLYVGVEVISYDTFTGFGKYLGYSMDTAKHFATYTGYALLVGYGVGITAIPKYISQRNALVIATILSMILVVLSVVTTAAPDFKTYVLAGHTFNVPTHPAVWYFALLGFSNSVMWPAIFPMAIEGLGKYTKMGSALLIMAIVGGAVLPPLYGRISETATLQSAYYMMIPAYLFILYFALSGYKVGRR
ncbi:glucose/galactose MFS transporter [Taibaiella sp. KBW10]|uniref:sugar MFS transporter n=1 Tax=Taibaiella sp. KBW10 TaxID=2153357 RepID=UPI000F591286|nr:sugar MFS transporter [Taibaiella sp. KBW10]RQO32480.1 glucose/galactose MFS transporter [Taibaiella sp. KBW10]